MFFASVLIRDINLEGPQPKYPDGLVPLNAIHLSPVGASAYYQLRPGQDESTPWIIFDDPNNCELCVVPQYVDFNHSFDKFTLQILDIISKSCLKDLLAIVEAPWQRPPRINRIYFGGRLRKYDYLEEKN